MTRIVTTHYRYKPPPRRRKTVAIAGSVGSTTSRNRTKLMRAEQRVAELDDDPEATARVKAFFARMMRPPDQ
jgi:hypothetical protein